MPSNIMTQQNFGSQTTSTDHFTDAQKRQLAMLVGANRVLWINRQTTAAAEARAWDSITEKMSPVVRNCTPELLKNLWAALKLDYFNALVHQTMCENQESVPFHRYFNKMKFLGEKVPDNYSIQVIERDPSTVPQKDSWSLSSDAYKRKYGVLLSEEEATSTREHLAQSMAEKSLFDFFELGKSPTKRARKSEVERVEIPDQANSIISKLLYKKEDEVAAPSSIPRDAFHYLLKQHQQRAVEAKFDLDGAIREAMQKTEWETACNTITTKSKESKNSIKKIDQTFNVDKAIRKARDQTLKRTVCTREPSGSASNIFDLDGAIQWAMQRSNQKKTEKQASTSVKVETVKEKQLKTEPFNLDEELRKAMNITGPSSEKAASENVEVAVKTKEMKADVFDLDGEIRKAMNITGSSNKAKPEIREVVMKNKEMRAEVFDLDGEIRKAMNITKTSTKKDKIDPAESERKSMRTKSTKAEPISQSTADLELEVAIKLALGLPVDSTRISSMKEPKNVDIFDLDGAIREAMEGSSSDKEEVASSSKVFDLDGALRQATEDSSNSTEDESPKEEIIPESSKSGLLVLNSEFYDDDELDIALMASPGVSFTAKSLNESEYYTDDAQSTCSLGKDSEGSSLDVSMVRCDSSVYKEEMESMTRE